jgi:hypothetical protein
MPRIHFVIQGIAPPGLAGRPASERAAFWRDVVALALRRKDWELAMGYNARGSKMPPVMPATRWNRRSEMTAGKRGDPYAPYLTPGRKLSRTRSLLTGRAEKDRAVFWWAYDRHTQDEWGEILEYHRRRGWQYDVIGLSPKGLAWVQAKAVEAWRNRLAGRGGVAARPFFSGSSGVGFQQAPATPPRRIASGPFAGLLRLLLAAIAAGLALDQIRKLLGDDFDRVLAEAERLGWLVLKRSSTGAVTGIAG